MGTISGWLFEPLGEAHVLGDEHDLAEHQGVERGKPVEAETDIVAS
ncbi:MAG TPA: hypothetical protein VHK26_08545 [Methyloceanibacter sp.]|nr:hypothetical protein [Methyloceanibacter sp.]